MPDASRSPPFGLGVDAGGTATRWQRIDARAAACLALGRAPPLAALPA